LNGADFLRSVQAHPQLHFGTGPRDDRIYVVALPFLGNEFEPDTRIGWELEPETICAHSWETLEAVLLGRRRPQVMSHVTRIVGYYSNLRSWNRSKLAELRDRHRGNYGVPGQSLTGEAPASQRAHARLVRKRAAKREAVVA
jgi:hypothetical protein